MFIVLQRLKIVDQAVKASGDIIHNPAVNFSTGTDGIGYILCFHFIVERSEQMYPVARLWKTLFQFHGMGIGHHQNDRCLVNQFIGELAAKVFHYVDADPIHNFYCGLACRNAIYRGKAGGTGLKWRVWGYAAAEQVFRHRAAANIARAYEKNIYCFINHVSIGGKLHKQRER